MEIYQDNDSAATEQLYKKAKGFDREFSIQNILCARCDNGTVYRRSGSMSPEAHCRLLERQVPLDIIECTSFWDQKRMSIHDMKEIALEIDKRTGIHKGAYR